MVNDNLPRSLFRVVMSTKEPGRERLLLAVHLETFQNNSETPFTPHEVPRSPERAPGVRELASRA